MTTAFANPDGSLATGVMNQTDQAVDGRFFAGQDEARLAVPAGGIQTLAVR